MVQKDGRSPRALDPRPMKVSPLLIAFTSLRKAFGGLSDAEEGAAIVSLGHNWSRSAFLLSPLGHRPR